MTKNHDDSDPGNAHEREQGREGRRRSRHADRDREDPGSACGSRDAGAHRRHRRRHHRHGGRKERVLHTRISDQLADDIRRLADDLRVPTSNLVRNVLEEVFTMVESVSDDVGGLFEDVLDEAEATRERVRRRADRHRGRGRARQGASHVDDRAVEDELRRDEAREASGEPEHFEAESGRAAPGAASGGSPDHPEPEKVFEDVLGWQPLILNRAARCAGCDVALHRGARAYIGLGRNGLTDTTVCRPCAGTLD